MDDKLDVKYTILPVNDDEVDENQNLSDVAIIDIKREVENNFYLNINRIFPPLYWIYFLFGLGYSKKVPIIWKFIHLCLPILFYLVYFITDSADKYGWINVFGVYLLFIYQALNLDHLLETQQKILRDNKVAFKRICMGITLTIILCTIGSFLYVILYVYKESNLTMIYRIYYSIGWSLVSVIIELTLSLLFISCYIHTIQQDIFLNAIKQHKLPYDPVEIGEIQDETPVVNTVDEMLTHYFKVRDCVTITSRKWTFFIVVSTLVLALYWVFGLYAYFYVGITNNDSILWVVGCPAAAIIYLAPVAIINIRSDNLLSNITDWSSYQFEERIFLINYFTMYPIRFNIVGITISTQLITSVTLALIGTGFSFLTSHLVK